MDIPQLSMAQSIELRGSEEPYKIGLSVRESYKCGKRRDKIYTATLLDVSPDSQWYNTKATERKIPKLVREMSDAIPHSLEGYVIYVPYNEDDSRQERLVKHGEISIMRPFNFSELKKFAKELSK